MAARVAAGNAGVSAVTVCHANRARYRGPVPGRNLTLDDVAIAAGVARVTVSRVINGDPQVSDRTRMKVSEAIKRLGYSVNHQARALASGGNRRLILFHAGSPDREPNSYYDSGLELGALKESSTPIC